MKTNSKTQTGIKVAAGIKAGGLGNVNRNRKALAVKTGIKAGEGIVYANHSRSMS